MAAACGDDEHKRSGGAADADGGRTGGSGASANDDNGCAEYDVHSSLTIPDMLIVLDRSASMAPDGNERMTDRWGGSVAAVEEVTKKFDGDIDFGLVTFPGPQATGGGGQFGGRGGRPVGTTDARLNCTPGGVNVDVGAHHADAISKVLTGMTPGGYTPTAATLNAVANTIVGGVGADLSVVPPRYVMLVTDGDPNCSGDLTGPLTADRVAEQDTINAIKSLNDQGVKTFVVGFQTAMTEFASVLDQMAVAGGTGDTQHHSVESGDDLVKTFEDLASRALSCSYKLAKKIDDPSYVLVSVAGKARGYNNASDGWTLGPDMQTITLTGGACEAVQKGASFRVEVTCEQINGF